ncbi:hypothetical protein RchiOBHm_Chr5g0050571 [Rosa chinensis]|uniref:Uncharacterized protein n=1 Tax=Rosa chinensis TaxID=74649 RepID=A0A2P6QF58_ROSCH|nr:hypothetical protein RchiOBHm_Chr5g0050571 [Rosa chinensis]
MGWFSPGSLGSGGDEKVSLRYWVLLRIIMYFGYDWICFLGLYWHQFLGLYPLNPLATSWSLIVWQFVGVQYG